jgi:hypothetical protein
MPIEVSFANLLKKWIIQLAVRYSTTEVFLGTRMEELNMNIVCWNLSVFSIENIQPTLSLFWIEKEQSKVT